MINRPGVFGFAQTYFAGNYVSINKVNLKITQGQSNTRYHDRRTQNFDANKKNIRPSSFYWGSEGDRYYHAAPGSPPIVSYRVTGGRSLFYPLPDEEKQAETQNNANQNVNLVQKQTFTNPCPQPANHYPTEQSIFLLKRNVVIPTYPQLVRHFQAPIPIVHAVPYYGVPTGMTNNIQPGRTLVFSSINNRHYPAHPYPQLAQGQNALANTAAKPVSVAPFQPQLLRRW